MPNSFACALAVFVEFCELSDCIPKNIPADLNTLIHVTGVCFPSGKEGRNFLMAEACQAYLA